MKQQKGFSLLEVLVSLMLVTTLALALLQQQWQTKLLLKQLLLRAGASQFLDQIDETLVISNKNTVHPPIPYHFKMQQSSQGSMLRLDWSKRMESIIRRHSKMKVFT